MRFALGLLELFCKRGSPHSWTRPRFCKAPSPRRRNAVFPPVKTACTSTAQPRLHGHTPSPRAAASANQSRRRPQNTAAKERDEDKCPQLHSCVSYEHRVCRDRTGQANPSARTADPVQCYPFLAFLWSYSVVKGGGDQLSGVHMSDGARTRTRPNVPRSPQAWSRPPSGKRGSRPSGPRATTRWGARRS